MNRTVKKEMDQSFVKTRKATNRLPTTVVSVMKTISSSGSDELKNQ